MSRLIPEPPGSAPRVPKVADLTQPPSANYPLTPPGLGQSNGSLGAAKTQNSQADWPTSGRQDRRTATTAAKTSGSGAPQAPAVSAYPAPNSSDDRGDLQMTAPPSREKVASPAKQNNTPTSARTLTAADESTVLSDADPEAWIPGAQYAQRLPRRGSGGNLQWRNELPALEGFRVELYRSAFHTLKELEPNHPQLRSVSSSTWVPEFADARRLNEEIARIKAERGLSELESHHNFPRQFTSEFRACGIEPEDYLTYLPRPLHRLKPDGLHATPINWNARWDRFLREQPEAKPEKLFEQLHNMWRSVPWLRR